MHQREDLKANMDCFVAELEDELEKIVQYWMENTRDDEFGGFYGRIDENNKVVPLALKGSVLNARILWSFSATFNKSGNPACLDHARRAYEYISDHFLDKEFGGVYWAVDYRGKPADTKKQVYAIAFSIYGLSEYYRASGDNSSLEKAKELFRCLEEHAYDDQNGGYFEAFSRNWSAAGDQRLSARDADEKKTMNTHLHVLEAYTNLYKVWPEAVLRTQIIALLHNFIDHMIDATNHLVLFLDESWNRRSETVSFGHDIEAAWLLMEAAGIVNDPQLNLTIRKISLQMSESALEGIDENGGMYYELENHSHLNREKHWWVQAEAMVGFVRAWQLSGNPAFAEAALHIWYYVKYNILDRKHGEWHWGINGSGKVMQDEDKVGIWKCPYHNSRACLEIIRSLQAEKILK